MGLAIPNKRKTANAILTDSKDPKQYIKRLRQRDEELSKGWVQFVPTLTVETGGGKQRMNCADLKGIFRIIQSIPSPKAEPFKRWLGIELHIGKMTFCRKTQK